jgi:hypothetical protein
MMVFQNYACIEEVVLGPYGETYATSHDADLAMNIKAEEVSGTEEEGDPLAITSPKIKAEPKSEEVSDAEEEDDPLAMTSPRIMAEPKAEEVSDAEEEEDPLAITSARITAEPEVSCMSLCHSTLLATF